MNRLAFDRVACARRGQLLFETLSFALGPGDAALVTGPNGAGKSSLVRIAAGLLAPASGAVIRDGGLALLAEATALDHDRTLADALRFWATLDGAAREAVPAALAALDLTPLAAAPVRILSTGQRRRAAMARVVASGSPIWLLDEPANGLDQPAVDRLAALIAEHRTRGGIALVATHLPIALPDAIEVRL
ncbi:heme exporter protein A [Sphingomonas jinjuensis]|uniref:Heme exporter protein A n=1 Tax=Sphingomonas jinjuensis TaxID=535907 RepID=A0A840F3V6_9SPHN|nr:heme ABC exporter ATP-binding protein CcmA [Sphingomonas jinjuensis]MBB4152489.1 heme exporter protein A [Sphingomonas jinjuensis]